MLNVRRSSFMRPACGLCLCFVALWSCLPQGKGEGEPCVPGDCAHGHDCSAETDLCVEFKTCSTSADCGGYLCNGDVCNVWCAADEDCDADGFVCDVASGICES